MHYFCPLRLILLIVGILVGLIAEPTLCVAEEDIVDLHQQQAKEKEDLNSMKGEIEDIKSTIKESFQSLGRVESQLNRQNVKEFHLAAKDATWELFAGTSIQALTYNGLTPGPLIRVQEGDLVRIILHNQLKVATSLHIHGLILPNKIDGLPRKGLGLVAPGETYAFQFVANKPGTFWYHPQVIHLDQQVRGLYGALIIEPKGIPKSFEKEIVAVLGQYQVANRVYAREPVNKAPKSLRSSSANSVNAFVRPTLESIAVMPTGVAPQAVSYFTVNGKCAPSIPPIEVHRGERVLLRIINGAQQTCPVHLTGHSFEVMSINGADALEPHVSRDSLVLAPADRMDVEFSADNPGVWSFGSEILTQSTNNGRFPGGIACVVRYPDSVDNE